MSFRLFIYYCAICGGWAAALGWALSRIVGLIVGEGPIRAVLQGLCLGVLIVSGLSLVDVLWNVSPGQTSKMTVRMAIAVALGLIGSLAGAALGQALHDATQLRAIQIISQIVGWTVTGLLIGASLGAADIIPGLTAGGGLQGGRRKFLSGVLGGSLGGLLGGALSLVLGFLLGTVFDKNPDSLKSSSAVGYVTLGTSIGLFIGLAQVMLKEAWLKVEAGFRVGREMILSRTETTLGRSESCDIGLFGDALVERVHARILREGGRYLLADAGSSSGTLLNDAPVTQPTPLSSGDAIRLGNSVLRFGERQKRMPT
jgi:hypothetical protein